MESPGGMGDDSAESSADDFVLEVTDLRTGRVRGTHLTLAEGGVSPVMEVSDDEFTVTSLDEDGSGAVRRSSRRLGPPGKRGVVIGIALLTSLAVILNLPGLYRGGIGVVRPAAPTAVMPIGPGGDVLYFVDIVPWGRLIVDGMPIPFFGDGAVATLARGRHQVQVVGAPFPTLRCVVSVPADQRHDTCPLGSGDEPLDTTSIQQGVRYIAVGETTGALPSDAFNQLLDEASAALTASQIKTTIAPGDHYLGVRGAAVAAEPLVASLTLDVNIDAARPFRGGDSCVSFCTGDQTQALSADAWSVMVHVLARWHFSTATGAYVPSADAVTDTAFDLSARWGNDGVWRLDPIRVVDALGDFCGDALFGASVDPALVSSIGPFYETRGEAPSAVDGCAMIIGASADVNERAPFPADAALYIYRYGVILAGNDLAHSRQPHFPVATDHERTLALQWLQPG